MKIAVISDIHGNMEALNAVIDDINKEKADKIFVCGDLAVAGPEPGETVDFFINLENAVIIKGNTDEWLFSEQHWPKNETMINTIKYTQESLSNNQMEFLKNLPEQYTEKLGELSIRLVHEEHIGEKLLGEASEDIIFCGHTHLPLTYKTGHQLLINTGSAGRPFTDIPAASYVVLEYPDSSKKDFTFRHKFVEYDKKLTAEKLNSLTFKNAENLAKVILDPSLRHELF